jgi:hypothetical protein
MRRIQTFKVIRREGATPTNSDGCRLFLIGVEKDAVLPSLRTVRAVLPHTALQSVVSSSGLARSQGCCHGEQSQVCEVHIWPASLLNHLCPLTPLPSAANIRSVQIARSTHAHSVGAVSVCLAFSGTVTESLMLVMLSVLYASTSLPPFPHAAFLLRTSRAAVCKV